MRTRRFSFHELFSEWNFSPVAICPARTAEDVREKTAGIQAPPRKGKKMQPHLRRYRRVLSGLLPAAALLLASSSVQAQDRVFDITLENLTSSAPNSGQPFSPPVFFTHDPTAIPWTAGDTASFPLKQIAEEGDNSPLLNDLATQLGGAVREVRTPTSGPLMPGQSITFNIVADASRPFLSTVWMLGRTNDGFAGIAGLNLFSAGAIGTFDLVALDAGTEVNNELAAFLPALGGVFNDPEAGVIAVHPGIVGNADAPASWGFNNPVARVTIAVSSAPEPVSSALVAFVVVPLALRLARRRSIRVNH
jgi:hypothetical protein